MEPAWHIYHLITFHLHKNGRGNDWASGRCIQKTIKKCYEINKFLTLTSPKNTLQSAVKVGTFLLSPLTICL